MAYLSYGTFGDIDTLDMIHSPAVRCPIVGYGMARPSEDIE